MSESENRDTKSSITNWPRKAMLTRTKPVDPSVTEICQQLTNVVSQQTALTEKLIGAFRETKENGQTNPERLQIPFLENGRFSPIHESFEDYNKPNIGIKIPISQLSCDSSFDTDFVLQLGSKKDSLTVESLSCVVSNVDTIRSYNSTAATKLRAILNGQTNQENLQNSLSQIYTILNLISIQCGNCKTGLTELDRIIQSQNLTSNTSIQTHQESKSTQTYSSDIDTGESDPDDKDSGLESNPGRPSESGISNEKFQLYTEYEELMQAPITEYYSEEINKSPNFLKSKKKTCPGELFEKNAKLFKPVCKGMKENEDTILGIAEKQIDSDSINDNTLELSPHTPEVFSAGYNCTEDSIQSSPLQETNEIEKKEITRITPPKFNKLQRAKTIYEYSTSKIFEFENEDEFVNLNKTQSPMEEKQNESDFANLENQVKIIKLHASTNSYSCKSRKRSLQSLVFVSRKHISNEVNNLVNKLTTSKRRKATQEDPTTLDETTKTLMDRVDQLMQVSQHFGATLHETSHSDEKEILINFIEMIKTLHRPTSIPNSNTICCTIQRTDSVASSGDNDRRPMSPTPVRYPLKSLESSYEKGFDEGITYVRDSLKEHIVKNSEYANKFFRVSDLMKRVLHSEKENRYRFLLASGAYLIFILTISIILNLFV